MSDPFEIPDGPDTDSEDESTDTGTETDDTGTATDRDAEIADAGAERQPSSDTDTDEETETDNDGGGEDNGDVDDSLDALYNINKHAKQYAELGTENYRKGKKTTAKANSNKKKALYAVKERVLTALMDEECADRVTRHEIRGDPFWCVYFTDSSGEEWSFHSPEENLDVEGGLVSDEPVRDLEDFTVGSEKERSTESLKDSLLRLERQFEVNANDYLPDQYLDYGRNRHFIGWKYLGKNTSERGQETVA